MQVQLVQLAENAVKYNIRLIFLQEFDRINALGSEGSAAGGGLSDLSDTARRPRAERNRRSRRLARRGGRGLCATQAHRRQGAHRAPQQGDDRPRVDVGTDPYEMSVKEKDI